MNNENKKNIIPEYLRQQVEEAFKEEPEVKAEENIALHNYPGSVHQRYMRELVESGKSVEEIQTLWHQYYVSLSDNDKKVVWQEFYESNTNLDFSYKQTTKQPEQNELRNQIKTPRKPAPISTPKIDRSKTSKVKLNTKEQIKSLGFGLAIGVLAVFIFLFGFFNQYIITPFVQPSSHQNVPIIIGQQDFYAAGQDQVIIPKINAQIPVDYSLSTTDEKVIEKSLDNGAVHYPITALPGQNGNAAFFGHSSSNIFNNGKYKFAFMLLHEMSKGDTFYLTYNHKLYIYKIISTQIVSPKQVSVLDPIPGQTATATLITCDPPGSSINRLVVVGQQISPNPNTNTEQTPNNLVRENASQLPGNGPSLFSKFYANPIGKVVLFLGAILLIFYFYRLFTIFR